MVMHERSKIPWDQLRASGSAEPISADIEEASYEEVAPEEALLALPEAEEAPPDLFAPDDTGSSSDAAPAEAAVIESQPESDRRGAAGEPGGVPTEARQPGEQEIRQEPREISNQPEDARVARSWLRGRLQTIRENWRDPGPEEDDNPAPALGALDLPDRLDGAELVFPSDEELAPPEPVHYPVVRAAQAGMIKPKGSKFSPQFFPLVNAKDESHEGLFARTVSSMAPKQPGQVSVLSYTFAPSPSYKQQANAWLQAIKLGEAPPEFNPSRRLPLLRILLSPVMLLHSISKLLLAHTGRPEAKNGDKDERYVMDDDDKAVRKLVSDKLKEGAQFETALRVVTAGVATADECQQLEKDLDFTLEQILETFSDHGTQHVALGWRRIHEHGVDAMLGLMPEAIDPPLLLSKRELAALVHIPDQATSLGEIKINTSRRQLPPQVMPPVLAERNRPPTGSDLIPIGIIDRGGDSEQIVAMHASELDQHMLITGKSGSGKSVELEGILLGAAVAGRTMVVIDPHDTLSTSLLDQILTYAPERVDDIVLLDASDDDFAPALNPLDVASEDEIEPVAHAVLTMLDAQGLPPSRARSYADKAIKALCWANLKISDPADKLGLLHVLRFFSDPEFRKPIVDVCNDPLVIDTFDFDRGTFGKLSEKDQQEHYTPVTQRIEPFARSRSVARLFASTRKLDFGQLISDGKIVLVRLSRRGPGQNVVLGQMLGQLIFPLIKGSMHQWTKTSGGAGVVCALDEAGVLLRANQDVPDILAENRKDGFATILSTQHADKFDAELRTEVLTNTGSKIILKADPNKTSGTEKSISSESTTVTADDLAYQPHYTAIANVVVPTPGGGLDGSGPMSLSTLPPQPIAPEAVLAPRRERAISQSRDLICHPAALIDRRLRNEDIFIGGPKKALLRAISADAAAQKLRPNEPEPMFSSDDHSGFDWHSAAADTSHQAPAPEPTEDPDGWD